MTIKELFGEFKEWHLANRSRIAAKTLDEFTIDMKNLKIVGKSAKMWNDRISGDRELESKNLGIIL